MLNRMAIFPIVLSYRGEIGLKPQFVLDWDESMFPSVKMPAPCRWKKGIREKGKTSQVGKKKDGGQQQ